MSWCTSWNAANSNWVLADDSHLVTLRPGCISQCIKQANNQLVFAIHCTQHFRIQIDRLSASVAAISSLPPKVKLSYTARSSSGATSPSDLPTSSTFSLGATSSLQSEKDQVSFHRSQTSKESK